MKRIKIYFLIIAYLILILIPLFTDSSYFMHIMIITYYIMFVSISWNILGGFIGQFSLGHAAFIGIGAYVATILLVNYGITPWLGLPLGGIISGCFAVIIFAPCFVLKGPYFTLATIALAATLRNLFINWDFVSRSVGIVLPFTDNPWIYMDFTSKKPYYFIILGLVSLLVWFVIVLDKSKLGFALKTVREDEDTAAAININPLKYKLITTFISAGLAAVAGGFYAQYIRYVDPDLMLINYSVESVLPSIIGGIGTVGGPILGALLLHPLSEFLRSTLSSYNSGINIVVYAIVLILIIRFKPEGIIGWLNVKFENLIRKFVNK
jgi:branched-chain amino acid transport system permease protein